VGIGGARNAGLFAAAILGATDPQVASRLAEMRREMGERVDAADARVRELIASQDKDGSLP
jgi:5-(carboxyamino)imidazole ribonucleotide mutase